MNCRPLCGACCIAPSITTAMPGMPNGKPAGVPCVHLDEARRCQLFGRPERPAFCSSLRPHEDMCGTDADHAMSILIDLELATTP